MTPAKPVPSSGPRPPEEGTSFKWDSGLIVFEGLDATGKSTQMQMLREVMERGHRGRTPLFTHQPSGSSLLTKTIYLLTEECVMNPLTRQLLHLSSHTEQYQNEIIPHLNLGVPVYMDRCWWSTIAYGFSSISEHYGIHAADFEWIAKIPTMGVEPDLVFYFNKTYQEDYHNTEEVLEAYERLAARNVERTIYVPKGTKEKVHEFIVERLAERGFIH